jgi:hypothetical protein
MLLDRLNENYEITGIAGVTQLGFFANTHLLRTAGKTPPHEDPNWSFKRARKIDFVKT